MPDNGGKLSQTTLFLRLLCGGYLIYLGIGILLDRTAAPLFKAAAVLFILVGAGLLAFTAWILLRRKDEPEDPDEENKGVNTK